jgi:predicted nucleic acid-binding protein
VLVDPIRPLRIFGVEPGAGFSGKVRYIYRKQIEEADLVVISKSDLLSTAQLESLRQAITGEYPEKDVLAVSVRDESNLDAWFTRLTSETQSAQTAMEVDYEIYADGEALLGWLNCTVLLDAPEGIDANAFLQRLAAGIQGRLRDHEAEVAHLKMTVSPNDSLTGEIAAVNLVRNDFVPELSYHLDEEVEKGELIINLRAEAAPDVLGDLVRDGLQNAAGDFPGLRATLDHLEHFRPGKPEPTHRIEEVTA